MSASRGCSDLPNTCIGFNDTALCIIPPKECWASIDRLRSLYDKAYEKWPPHINVVYPFVHPGALHRATELISLHLSNMGTSVYNGSLPVSLQAAGVFTHRHSNTVFIHDSKTDSTSQLNHIRQCIFDALGGKGDKHRMHMTIGQTDDINSAPHKFLLQKAGFIPPIQWDVVELAVLVRDTTQLHGQSSRQMKLWGTISLKDLKVYPVSIPTFLPRTLPMATRSGDAYMLHEDGCQNLPPLRFSEVTRMWEPYHFSAVDNEEDNAETFKVATYNVLAEFHHPPSHTRYPFLIKNLLEASALADVLVLQEVTDDFLCYLLNDSDIRNKYPFVSNGPPDQLDIDPLPSHLTVVVMSQWSFTWNWLSFRRLHKGSMVVQFDQLGKKDGETFFPAILSTVHLTCGLTDGAVAAKKAELQSILRYLSFTHPQNPWIIAGDFNITTSAFTIRAALEKQAISKQSADYLTSLESSLSESGLYDTWITARLENLEASHLNNSSQQLDEIFEGEQGASFDPTTNDLAAAIAGSGFNNRPQRYHRIVLKPAGLFSIQGFNMFGQHAVVEGHDAHGKAMTTYASDHWGIRCSLRMTEISRLPSSQIDASQTPARIVAQTVSESLSDVSTLRISLSTHGVYPSEADVAVRVEALELLEAILCDVENEEANAQSRHGVYFVVVPVGSYGLGTWTPSSDVDCLCIGSISPRTFFSLATQRLRKASPKNVRILRRVNALSGTMLELEILGVKMDLQYCPSALIAETWPRTMRLPATSPVFTLPVQTLAKLKPARDLYYLRQTVPDFAAFRTAFYLIKAWAKQRGIYAARFGYLGGIHIAVLLSLVCKLLSRDHGSASVPTIILTFFNHYARFDWKKQMVFDPFFHKRLRYTRTSREPMVILGFHSPSLNVASSASQPSVRTISEELQNADRFLSREGVTWEDFLSNEKNRSESGAATFLKTYKSYVKIDVQFWGISHARGSQFVGWLESRCVMLLVGGLDLAMTPSERIC